MTASSGSPAILPPTIESWVAADRALDAGVGDRITMFMRPLASTAELLAAIGPALARRGLMSPGPAKAASALARMPAMQLHMAEKRILPRLRPRR